MFVARGGGRGRAGAAAGRGRGIVNEFPVRGEGDLPPDGANALEEQDNTAVLIEGQPPAVAGGGLNNPELQQMIAAMVAQALANGQYVAGAADPRDNEQEDGAEEPEDLNQNEVDRVLITCGIVDANTREIIRVSEAFNTLDSFRLLEDDEAVDAWLKRAVQKPAQNRLSLGEVQIYNLKGLAYWVRDRIARELPLVAEEFDIQALREAIEMRGLEKKKVKDEDIKEPEKCETGTGWDEWKESFINYCSQKRSIAGGPLSYVIREHIVDTEHYNFRDEQERKLYQYPHQGNAFLADNRRVAQLLKSSTLTTDAYVYVESSLEAMNGRKAWLELVDHYDGDGEKEKRTSKAQADLKALHYRGNELVFPFETFSTKFLKALKVLNKSPNHAVAPGAQVDMLMQKMSGVSNTSIQAAMELVASKHRDNVHGCINELSTTIAKRLRDQVHMRDRKGDEKRRKIADVNRRTDASGGRGRGRGGRLQPGRHGGRGGRGGRGTGGKMEINGVDVSDPSRTFTPDEMTQLGKVGRDYVFAKRQSNKSSIPKQARNTSEASVHHNPTSTDQPRDTDDGKKEKGAKNGAKFGSRN